MNAYSFQPRAFAPRAPRPLTTRGGGVILRAIQGESLSLEQVAAAAPAVFADDKHDSRSERYVFADTREVLGGLVAEGFQIMEVRQGGSRIAGKSDFTKHMIRMTTPGGKFNVEPRVGDISAAQVVLINSHDGTSSYQLRAGFLRWVCTNGMTVGDDFETFRIGHVKGVRDKVIDAAYRVVNDFPRAVDSVREMAGTGVSGREALAFARAALQLRWAPDTDANGAAKAPPISAEQLLAARRYQDNGADLWQTMNRVQENLIRGGQSYRLDVGEPDRHGRRATQRRTVGAVSSIDQDSAINRALWTLTEEFRKLKAAA